MVYKKCCIVDMICCRPIQHLLFSIQHFLYTYFFKSVIFKGFYSQKIQELSTQCAPERIILEFQAEAVFSDHWVVSVHDLWYTIHDLLYSILSTWYIIHDIRYTYYLIATSEKVYLKSCILYNIFCILYSRSCILYNKFCIVDITSSYPKLLLPVGFNLY